jgi:1,4-dihydroxy-2-naphthoate octaprenyltransferase
MRQFIIDLVAFQGDLILGRDTLPTSLGIKRAIKMTLAIAIAGALIFSAITIYHGNWLYLLLNSSVLYYYFLLRKIKETAYLVSIRYEILIDLNFALMFLCYLATGLHF